MWVNPHWEEEKSTHQSQDKSQTNQDEVIINGVSVRQEFSCHLVILEEYTVTKSNNSRKKKY